MRAGVLVAIGGAAAVLVATVPASAFNSGSDPDSYYSTVINGVQAHRGWQGTEGTAYEPVGEFTRRLPDDEFDAILLNLVNWYRSDNGLAPLAQFESLRVQSAIWSNKLADWGSADHTDPWYSSDAVAACNPLRDIFSASGESEGRPDTVYLEWLQDPAARNAMLSPDADFAGVATVSEGSRFFTTMRIADGTCPGGGLPFRTVRSGLPTPKLEVHTPPNGLGLTVEVDRRGDSQQLVQLQRAAYGVWVKWEDHFLQPGSDELRLNPPGGQYRVVVPRQSGYDVAFTDMLDVAGPALPAQ